LTADGREQVFAFPSDALTTMQCMDRVALEEMLAEGLSLAEIGRRVGRHESTVAYWAQKFGLTANHGERHASKGPLARAQLEPLVESGSTIAEIAAEVGRSKTTVRHWLQRHGLKTQSRRGRCRSEESRAASAAGITVTTITCPRHGQTAFVLDGRGYYRCRRCRAEAVSRRRRGVKEILVRESGGACSICGYASNMRALHFHHVRPDEKQIEFNGGGLAQSLETLRAEARKCVLLCSNCHAEVEAGVATLTHSVQPAVQLQDP
jgi:transposase